MTSSLAKSDSQERNDLVAYWSVPLTDGVHTVEFEHGTTSGKRVIRVDGKVSNEKCASEAYDVTRPKLIIVMRRIKSSKLRFSFYVLNQIFNSKQ